MGALATFLSVLAVWRITYMLQDENGPWAIFVKLQAWVAKQPDYPGSFADGFYCFYCLSVYVAIPFAIYLTDGVFRIVGIALALSAGAILVNSLHNILNNVYSDTP